MATITSVKIRNYRSAESVHLRFPAKQPLVLLGENNAGKSNLVKALELVLGPIWPGNHEPEEHEFYQRSTENPISISVDFSPESPMGRYRQVTWKHDYEDDPATRFYGYPPSNPSYEYGYISREDRETCISIVLHAERNLDYQLSYRSKWTFLSRLMHRFHRALGQQEGVRQQLAELFDSIKNSFREIPQFKVFVEQLQTQVNELAGSMTHRLEVDFEAYNPTNFFHALRLTAVDGPTPRTLEELGTGEQQILAMAFAHAFAQAFHGGVFLVVEEPEAHLHPLAQDWLARRLTEMAASGLQILITSHSPAFVDLASLEGIALVRKGPAGTTVTQIDRQALVRRCLETGVPEGRVTEANVLPFYTANATREILEGFFSKVVVLVEGPTESLALPILLERCGLITSREGVAVTPVFGKGNLAKWNRLFGAYGIPCYVIFDNDAGDDSLGAKRIDALCSLGVSKEAAASLVKSTDWSVEADYCVFGTNYEAVMRAEFTEYTTLEAVAVEEGIDSKPFIARWVASRMEYNEGQPGWVRLNALAKAIEAKLS
jgi:putative ATP-dependent endonuclease of OLD family